MPALSSFRRYCPSCNVYGFVTRENLCYGCGEGWHYDSVLLRKQKIERSVPVEKEYTTSVPSAPKGWEKV